MLGEFDVKLSLFSSFCNYGRISGGLNVLLDIGTV